ncbi:MAG: sensor histidine kinase [Actinomycetales bacterium]|nr:sensor histidine kinase [Actinomycetales bacterium]
MADGRELRGWDLAVAGTVVVTAGLLGLTLGLAPRALVGFGLLAALGVAWVALGRGACRDEGGPRAIAFLAILPVLCGALVAVSPFLAIVQALAYPLAWTITTRVRQAVLANAAIALAVGVGFLVSAGTRPNDLLQTAATVALSLAFSIALGLWITRIAAAGAEKARLLAELTAAQDELAALHRDRGAVAERERLARELHDTIAQSLTGLVLLGQRARRELRDGALDDETLALLEDAAREALGETRALVAATAAVELGSGLEAALERLAARFTRETGIAVETRLTVGELDRDAEVVVLRCAQEGLANVRKHSGAATARVELEAEAGQVVVRVRDDGRGFDPVARRGDGFGLDGLAARLELVGGRLELDGTAGATVLTARIPTGAGA